MSQPRASARPGPAPALGTCARGPWAHTWHRALTRACWAGVGAGARGAWLQGHWARGPRHPLPSAQAVFPPPRGRPTAAFAPRVKTTLPVTLSREPLGPGPGLPGSASSHLTRSLLAASSVRLPLCPTGAQRDRRTGGWACAGDK